MRRLLAVLIPTCLFLYSMPLEAQLASAPWPCFGHDLRNTRQSEYVGTATPTQKWVFRTGDSIYATPAVGSDGTVYVGSLDSKLYAINEYGVLRWTSSAATWIPSSPAIGSDGTIYVGSSNDNLYAVNPDGSQKWIFRASYEIQSSPVIGPDGTVYVGSDDGNLYAINRDGSTKWVFQTGVSTGPRPSVWNNGKWVRSTPAITSDGTVYVGCQDTRLYAVNSDGTQKWSFKTGGPIHSSAAIGFDGTIYIGSEDNNLYAVNSDGSQKWAFNTDSSVDWDPAISTDGTIYVVSNGGSLYALNPDGSLKWVIQANGSSSPILDADGTIYLGLVHGLVAAINSDSTWKWVSGPGDWDNFQSPSIGADGTVYVGSLSGAFYAFGIPTVLNVNINLGDYIGDFSLMLVRVNVLRTDGTIQATQTVPAAALTSVNFTNIPTGDYIVQAFAPKRLSQSQPVTINSTGISTINVTLLNGDLNGDNFIEDQDYSIMGASWYQSGT
jgi:outer membrane protein assembly factor BamB